MVTRIAISGCSGAGKSSLLEEMARRGWATCEEPGRRVVRAETAHGGDGLPWRDAETFARLCIELCIEDVSRPARGPVLHDRCLVDAVSALRRMGRMTAEDAALLAAHRYAETVFLAPPWPEIFGRDAERRHGLEEAMRESEDLCEAFPAAGYAIEELPRRPLAERADWLEARLREREPAR